MPSYWEKRAEKKRITAEYKKEMKLEAKVLKETLKANEAACKRFLAEYKRTHSASEFKNMNERCKREMSENRKWSKLSITNMKASKKVDMMMACDSVDGHRSQSGVRALRSAMNKLSATRDKLSAWVDKMYESAQTQERVEQLDERELTYVAIGAIPHVTQEEVRENLLAEQAPAPAPAPAPERGSLRVRVVYDEEVEVLDFDHEDPELDERENDGREQEEINEPDSEAEADGVNEIDNDLVMG